MPNDRKTTMDVFRRFPKNRKTLGVRWLKRHGVTDPLVIFLTDSNEMVMTRPLLKPSTACL